MNQPRTIAARWKLTLSQMTTNWGCSGLGYCVIKCVQKANNEGCVVGTEDAVVLILLLLLLQLSSFCLSVSSVGTKELSSHQSICSAIA